MQVRCKGTDGPDEVLANGKVVEEHVGACKMHRRLQHGQQTRGHNQMQNDCRRVRRVVRTRAFAGTSTKVL